MDDGPICKEVKDSKYIDSSLSRQMYLSVPVCHCEPRLSGMRGNPFDCRAGGRNDGWSRSTQSRRM